jgi:hemolysin D
LNGIKNFAGAIPEVQVVEVKQKANESANLLIRAEGAVQDAEKLLQGQRKTYEKLMQQMQAEQTQSQLRLQEQQGNQKSIEQGGELTLSKSQQQLDDLEAQLTTLKSEIKQTQKQIQSLTLQLEQRVVRSPENGVIFQLPIKKAQAFVQPGQVVAQIAPQGLPLILKAQASSQQTGQMKVGMPVKLKFDAYPFQDYGVVPGRLKWISPDSKTIDLGQGQGQAEVFELEVTLDKTYIENADKRIQLTPGQAATAETIIRQRRIIDFILDPFRQLQKGGLKL